MLEPIVTVALSIFSWYDSFVFRFICRDLLSKLSIVTISCGTAVGLAAEVASSRRADALKRMIALSMRLCTFAGHAPAPQWVVMCERVANSFGMGMDESPLVQVLGSGKMCCGTNVFAVEVVFDGVPTGHLFSTAKSFTNVEVYGGGLHTAVIAGSWFAVLVQNS